MLPRWNGSPPPRSLDGRLAMKMNPAPRRDGSRRVIAGIVLSVVAHLLLVFVLWAVVPDTPPPQQEASRAPVGGAPKQQVESTAEEVEEELEVEGEK